jgi:hypothetical protein
VKKSATLYYPLGHKRFDTPTVRDLRRALRAFPPDTPVLATWEGTIQPVCEVSMERPYADEERFAVVLDVEHH